MFRIYRGRRTKLVSLYLFRILSFQVPRKKWVLSLFQKAALRSLHVLLTIKNLFNIFMLAVPDESSRSCQRYQTTTTIMMILSHHDDWWADAYSSMMAFMHSSVVFPSDNNNKTSSDLGLTRRTLDLIRQKYPNDKDTVSGLLSWVPWPSNEAPENSAPRAESNGQGPHLACRRWEKFSKRSCSSIGFYSDEMAFMGWIE